MLATILPDTSEQFIICYISDLMICFVTSYSAEGRPDWIWSGVGFRLDDRV